MSHSLKVPFCARTTTGIITAVAILSILIITLTGCRTTDNKRAMNIEEVLYKAGFQMKPADTREKPAHLKTLPQRKIVPHVRKGNPRYFYADADVCKCLYLGDRDAFQSFQHILLEQVSEHEYVAGGDVDYVEIDWDNWGDFTEVVVEENDTLSSAHPDTAVMEGNPLFEMLVELTTLLERQVPRKPRLACPVTSEAYLARLRGEHHIFITGILLLSI